MTATKDVLEEIINRAAKEEITRQALKLFSDCEEEEAEQGRRLARLAVLYHGVSKQSKIDDTTEFYMAYKQRAGEFLERFTEEFFSR